MQIDIEQKFKKNSIINPKPYLHVILIIYFYFGLFFISVPVSHACEIVSHFFSLPLPTPNRTFVYTTHALIPSPITSSSTLSLTYAFPHFLLLLLRLSSRERLVIIYFLIMSTPSRSILSRCFLLIYLQYTTICRGVWKI